MNDLGILLILKDGGRGSLHTVGQLCLFLSSFSIEYVV